MGRSLEQIMDSLPAERRKKIEARFVELVAEDQARQDSHKHDSHEQVKANPVSHGDGARLAAR